MTGNGTTKYVLRGKINKLKNLRGYSAYEIAVLNGYKGTEKEWLKYIACNGNSETWQFTLGDGSTIEKVVYVKYDGLS